MYVPRTLEAFLKKASTQFPIVLLTGPRQAGKTTLLRHARAKGRAYVTLDDPLALNLAKEDPALFLQRFPSPALIDEIQYAPGLLPYLKMEADKNRRPGAYWLTGSQQFQLMKGVSESLAGRVAILNLAGLSRRERSGEPAKTKPFLPSPKPPANRGKRSPSPALAEIYRMIWRGSYPAIALNEAVDWEVFYGSYVQTYLQRDVRDLARVGDEMAFLRFLRGTAARTGQLLNLAELARDADIAPNTAKNWLSILQASGIVHLLEPWHTNATKRLVKAPKLYFLDTGLCAFLTEWTSPETLEAGAMSGAMLESWVVGELLKSYWHNGRKAPFYFYRDKDQAEIDLLIVRDGTVYPIEIKKTASPNKGDVQRFQVLDKLKMPVGPGGLICFAEESLPLTASARSIPISEI